MLTSLDILFTGLAFIILVIGLLKLKKNRLSGHRESMSGDMPRLVQYLAGHKKIMENPLYGILHLFVFWGFLIPLIIIILAQFGFALPGPVAGVLSLFTDLLGCGMLFAIIFFCVKTVASKNEKGILQKLLPILLLLIILVTGFLAEGSRLGIIKAGFSAISPLGSLISVFTPDSPLFMQAMIRVHLFCVLIFIALVPFTFMRHIPAGLQNVFLKRSRPQGELGPVDFDKQPIGSQKVSDFSSKQLLDAQACVACDRCSENCPATISGKPLIPRKIMQDIFKRTGENPLKQSASQALLETDITADEIWSCTTCMACVEACPMYIEPMDKIIDMRRHLVLDKGLLPKEAWPMIRNLELFGDVYGKGASHRSDWRLHLNAPTASELSDEPEILLWIGCSGAFHPRYSAVARKMARILTAAGINFAVLGNQELCCGDGARRLGEEAVFQDLAQRNIKALESYDANKIVAFCPHCFNTLKNEYPALGGNFDVIPAVSYLCELMEDKKIVPKYPVEKRITIHDPCYLGRINDIYEPLREVVTSIPGLELFELDRSRSKGFCCGGGGGRMWLHESLGKNINQIRSDEIGTSNPDIVGCACPFCMTMLDDGMSSLVTESVPDVLDLVEIVALSLGIDK